MPLFELTAQSFRPIPEVSFTDLKIRERGDLQRLLRNQIEVLGEDLYVLAEEFGDWEDSKRRIDLLALDKQANLVVIELKRTADGGHMDLQGLRYAAMVSAMTFDRAVQIHGDFLAATGGEASTGRSQILEFLGWGEPEEESFADDVRIFLVSEDFSKELTTAVLWLREREIDIRCIRLRPYSDGNSRLVDVQPLIPLPEAQEYQVQLREKEQVGRKKRAERDEVLLRFWQGVIGTARKYKSRHANLKPSPASWISASSGVRGLGFNYVVVQNYAVVELYLDRKDETENKSIFDRLSAHRDQVNSRFGEDLQWERLDGKQACRIKHILKLGGYRSPESSWPEIHEAMVTAMAKFEAALKPEIDALGL